jgi:cyclic pyranopterin phosphate synthase
VLGAVRAGVRGPALEAFLARIWSGRMDRYSDERAELISRGEVRPKAEMSYLGG